MASSDGTLSIFNQFSPTGFCAKTDNESTKIKLIMNKLFLLYISVNIIFII